MPEEAFRIHGFSSDFLSDKETFDQIAQYNLSLNSDYLMITNGLYHYYCQMDFEQKKYIFLKDLPPFKSNMK